MANEPKHFYDIMADRCQGCADLPPGRGPFVLPPAPIARIKIQAPQLEPLVLGEVVARGRVEIVQTADVGHGLFRNFGTFSFHAMASLLSLPIIP